LNRNLSLYGALLLILQGLASCGQPSPATEARQQSTSAPAAAEDVVATKLIIAFGDSLYAGYQLGPNEGFAPQMQAALKAKGIAAKVVNAGVSGDTTEAGKARLAFVLDAQKRKPDLVILGLGGNDMLRGIKPAQTRANMTAMMETLKKRGIKIVLTGILASPNMGPDYARAFNPIFPDLAKKYDAPFYPFFLDGVIMQPDMMLNDGIHPNAKGVTRVVAGVEPLVSKVLADME
jgi:acyl-CoA thioesterase I